MRPRHDSDLDLDQYLAAGQDLEWGLAMGDPTLLLQPDAPDDRPLDWEL